MSDIYSTLRNLKIIFYFLTNKASFRTFYHLIAPSLG